MKQDWRSKKLDSHSRKDELLIGLTLEVELCIYLILFKHSLQLVILPVVLKHPSHKIRL